VNPVKYTDSFLLLYFAEFLSGVSEMTPKVRCNQCHKIYDPFQKLKKVPVTTSRSSGCGVRRREQRVKDNFIYSGEK
jgi:hypothetical protein